jgi:DNA helicase II / ATP-dependent DNA helicase PcrA
MNLELNPRDKKKEDISISERENLLNDFLSKINPAAIIAGSCSFEDKRSGNELEQLSADDYPSVEIGPETGSKIKELALITEGIESKVACCASLPSPVAGRNLKIDYAALLNMQQLHASVHTSGPVLVIAGAGTGKTRVIVHRMAYLLETGVPPERILLLTFTRKAAKEMQNRAQELLRSAQASLVSGGTYHSFSAVELRKHANIAGMPANFSIIDQSDAEDTIDLIRTAMKYNTGDKKFPKKARLQEILSSARNRNKTVAQVIAKDFSGLIDYTQDIELVLRGYTQYKETCAVFDFDDLMEKLRDGLRDKPVFRETMQLSYDYIMIDEFQDTNIVQKEIVDILAAKHRNIMAVGDDAQSIYSFRGANFENILRFPETYPDCTVIKIQQNYRSNKNILRFTNDIIRSSRFGYKKELYSENISDSLPVVRKFLDQESEAKFIVSKIKQLHEKDIPLSQIAVLNRADWHNRYIQAELHKNSIPYVVIGGFRFNERKHVKDIISFLRIIHNPLDAVAWHRVLKLVTGIGVQTASQIVKSLMEAGGEIHFGIYHSKKFFADLQKLEKMLSSAASPRRTIASKVEVAKEYYMPLLESRDPDYKMRLLDIDVLIDLAANYSDLNQFLSDFALDPPNKGVAGQSQPLINESEAGDKLTISTIHSAKGLEWHTVFIPHALDGMLPSSRACNLEDMEEERRLFYVACSRAKEHLYISYPSFVESFNAYFTYPSRFLVELSKGSYMFEK